ncbi:hypothetical protein [Corynebacterium sp. 335C]
MRERIIDVAIWLLPNLFLVAVVSMAYFGGASRRILYISLLVLIVVNALPDRRRRLPRRTGR